jgi:hypothetical protein
VTQQDHVANRELVEQLRLSIARLREDVEARGDPVLADIARALTLIVDLSIQAHQYALETRARIEELEAGGAQQT